METIVVVLVSAALALLGVVIFISEWLRVEDDSASAPAQIDCDPAVADRTTHSAPLGATVNFVLEQL